MSNQTLTWPTTNPSIGNNLTINTFSGTNGTLEWVPKNNIYSRLSVATWTGRTPPGDGNSWRSVTWSPELEIFCAVAVGGTNRVMTSPDGKHGLLEHPQMIILTVG